MKKITLALLIVFTITAQGQNKVYSGISEYYDATSSSWQIQSSGSNYEYDSNNNLIANTYVFWNGSNWEINAKDSYSYNANNKATQNIYQNWNATTKQYDNSYKTTYTYNANGNIIGVLDENWDVSQWVNFSKTDIYYTSNGLLNNYLSYKWEGSQWVNDYRGELTYNLNNKIISSIDEKWNGSQWVNSYKDNLTYNGNNKIISYVSEKWNGSSWENNYTDTYTYDSNGNRITYIENYGSQYKTVYNYDSSAQMSGFIHPFKDKTGIDYIYEDFPYINKVLSENVFIFENGGYVNNYRTTYNYSSSIALGTEKLEMANNTIIVFPNPTTSILNFQYPDQITVDKIKIIDSTGKMVLQQNQNLKTINVENLAKGLYIIEWHSGKEKFQTKFIKK
ncbi:T9SS type A sorting domain-containing protein [Flavobacterium franklandianum]|uniref:T9SS type A sorting domain-containing protein n=1 Tax=Flavobacterium franklandianum TaxID=2594430 RepID=A0A553C5Y6_9FLAO|nr:T9SS type A sorting domain-containing protein [Flavobacterium franklandianum]TRX15947.1 T9SS type A sorting domain-containing protein [Flavobacterium franklandianum]TRX27748.1 T9SS type A sorting domain-containing protein [Flavobacterium franklandianum]